MVCGFVRIFGRVETVDEFNGIMANRSLEVRLLY